jgi:hypothetical protein
MSDEMDDELPAVAAEIVRYLRAHPDAADTVDGVARWWLGRDAERNAIERAMALLVKRRMVEKHTLPEGTTVFRSGPGLTAQAPSHHDES